MYVEVVCIVSSYFNVHKKRCRVSLSLKFRTIRIMFPFIWQEGLLMDSYADILLILLLLCSNYSQIFPRIWAQHSHYATVGSCVTLIYGTISSSQCALLLFRGVLDASIEGLHIREVGDR